MAAITLLEGFKTAASWLVSLLLPAGPPFGPRAQDSEIWAQLVDRL